VSKVLESGRDIAAASRDGPYEQIAGMLIEE
jgi:hypothetical protein